MSTLIKNRKERIIKNKHMKINIEDFIKKLENEFDELEKGTLNSETNFRDIEEWSSMHALIIIALIDAEYSVTINGEDLQHCKTVRDLFQIVQTRS
jgi:acyl carrier protein